MGDEEIRQTEFGLQVFQQVENLGLDGDVQRRHRFVQHQKRGLQSQGSGDGDPLSLPAGELVGEPAQGVGWQLNQGQQFRDLLAGHRFGDAMDPERLVQDLADSEPGIEGGVGILEDDLHLLA